MRFSGEGALQGEGLPRERLSRKGRPPAEAFIGRGSPGKGGPPGEGLPRERLSGKVHPPGEAVLPKEALLRKRP